MSRFAESKFLPIRVGEDLVHARYESYFSPGDMLKIEWLEAGSDLVQGLGLRMRFPGVVGTQGIGGELRIENANSSAMMLWMDTSPEVVTVHSVASEQGAKLQISNRWRQKSGREDEWLNNYGMLVDQQDESTVVLSCSDGYGTEPTFDDLKVKLTFVRS